MDVRCLITKHDDEGSEISDCGMTTVFRDGTRKVAYELQSQNGSNPKEWNTVGTSPTLARARKALLFYAPIGGFGIS